MDSRVCLPHHCSVCSLSQDVKSDSGNGSLFMTAFGCPASFSTE